MTPRELIDRVGGASVVAKALGVCRTTPMLWKKIPPHHCPAIERAFDIPREELRPDLFQRSPANEPAA
ncbi:transcriptional regulator [Acetobacter oeni]|uniref:Uncharacterized protein n=1 Tax=Acetobacter oeni TaxID=304077 RepID=A0A511XJQ3_9PROT|nr:YdaS family helix-turn-helix protein [Acetobacter oeni]MBB3883393.1 DNA-binding transcriptional regulator YdaS (Cro superfamily) [Acetobacter oeni]GBR03935.1 hypothetical protein AA21952_1231 [Acetobacter oeni LMG 21952]GEN63174.1 hypothetical protein AOE01nite_13980 [Acetobacter oeni]